ncbi:unnamed protein product [Cunninghamella blakesleeana]
MKSIELSVLSRVTQRTKNTNNNAEDGEESQYLPEPKTKLLSLSNGQSALTFARYIRTLELIYEALASNIIMAKRDVFYRDIPLFKTQPVVDRIIDDISCHFNVPRSCLNISASGKGRIYGPINIILRNYRVIDCMATLNDKYHEYNDDTGVLIPPINQILDIESYAKSLIVIEKEATFRHLVSIGFVQSQFQRCVLVTGCGYPDLATRHMIKHISTRYPKMPIFGLFDNDPYGLEIFSVYKWGSLAQSFDSVNLTIPDIQYLGLKHDDRSKYNIPERAYIPLTQKDREKGFRMIRAIQQLQNNPNYDITPILNELCKILHINQKCELQALYTDGPMGLIDYLFMKFDDLNLS